MHFGRKQTLMDRAHDYVDHVADTVIPQIQAALEDAADKAGPALTDARDRAKPLLDQGRAVASEKAAVGATLAAEKAREGATLAAEKATLGRDLAAAKVAELKTEPEPKGGKLKKLLLLGGLLAIGGVVFSKLRGQSESSNWQSSYVPTPPPSPSGTPSTASTTTDAAAPMAAPVGDPLDGPMTTAAGESDDPGGGSPGEAISDSAETPQASTNPDDPAAIIDVDDRPDQPRP